MTRMRLRIKARMEELGISGRELARAARPDVTDRELDSWISGILKGAQGLHWKHFDAVAAKLGLSPSELVRYDDSELRELTPREMRLLRHYQEWPSEIQNRWLDMLEHFASTVPDAETATLLDRLRRLPRGLRLTVLDFLYRTLEEGIPQDVLDGGVRLGPGEAPAVPGTPRQGLQPRKSSGSRKRAVDPPPP